MVRWGIFGTGPVAQKFALALTKTRGARLAFVASRTAAGAERFAQSFGIERALEGYADAAAAGEADIVYIATPASEHRAHALACIAGGKAVLVEKPLATDAADAAEITQSARRAGVFCMEAMWTRFLPAVGLARRLIGEGALGEIRDLEASFATPLRLDPDLSIFNPKLAGGALLHRGVYPISLALDLLGPAELGGAVMRLGETDVDEDVWALLRHASGATSTIQAGLRTRAGNGLTIRGEEANLEFVGPIYRPFGVRLTRITPGGGETGALGRAAQVKELAAVQAVGRLARSVARPPIGGADRIHAAPYRSNGYVHQAEAVTAALAEGRLEHPAMPHAATLAAAKIMDEIRQRGLQRAAAPRVPA